LVKNKNNNKQQTTNTFASPVAFAFAYELNFCLKLKWRLEAKANKNKNLGPTGQRPVAKVGLGQLKSGGTKCSHSNKNTKTHRQQGKQIWPYSKTRYAESRERTNVGTLACESWGALAFALRPSLVQ